MYEKILFPTDFSEYSQKTLKCIGDIPGIKDVILLHVVDATHYSKQGWTYEQDIKDSKIRIEEQKEHLVELGLKIETKVNIITNGDIADDILKTAEEEKVSLIVMDSRGKSLIVGLLLGSTSLEVIRHAKIDTLLMHYKFLEGLEGEKFQKFCPRILSKVLCPTDFSKSAKNTISFIKDLGINEMFLVHVVTKGETKEEIDANIQDARDKLAYIKDTLKLLNIKEHIRVGNPAKEICSVAEDEDVSIIAMSSHGKDWLKELLFGDTTFDVVKMSKRPVLVIRKGSTEIDK